MNDVYEQMLANGWQLPVSKWQAMTDPERAFARLEFTGQRSFTYYRDRLIALGLSGRGRVLDVGCGMGQWSVALASLNDQVVGIEISSRRLVLAQALAEAHGLTNCRFEPSSAEELPFESGSFQALFCYGVFMFTHMRLALAEFARVLRPGGSLYLNANSWGWYWHLLIDRGLRQGNLDLAKTSLKMMLRALGTEDSNRLVTEGWLRRQLESAGFRVLDLGCEGSLQPESNGLRLASAYPERFYGQRAILEVLAERR